MIEVSGVSKKFKVHQKSPGFWSSVKSLFKRNYVIVSALKNVSFCVDQGEIVGLVGENGAGKSTLLKILSGIFPPDTGAVRCLGFVPSMRKRDYLLQVCFLSGNRTQLYWDLTPLDSFALLAKIYDVDESYQNFVNELSEILNVQDKLYVQLRRLSLGERMKMELIGGFLYKPKLIFLDEPTLGLDLNSQQEIRLFVKNYVARQHATAIITSHYMKDIEEICERIIFLHKGSIQFDGTKEEIFKRFGKNVKIYFDSYEGLNFKGKIVQGYVEVPESELSETLAYLAEKKTNVTSIEIEDFTSVMSRFFESHS
ncbi:MAG: ATP-binding cassette domain-containing protein [Deltaproteobacteria bacterium]|nr:ATP-binding cassette domain-containing protein [Deltaproteobacteria bacterium]